MEKSSKWAIIKGELDELYKQGIFTEEFSNPKEFIGFYNLSLNGILSLKSIFSFSIPSISKGISNGRTEYGLK
ncbi:MAG: hypothetical protein ACTSVU_03740 [Promethearchaeota archaeon]